VKMSVVAPDLMHALNTHSLLPSHICQVCIEVCIHRGLPFHVYRGLPLHIYRGLPSLIYRGLPSLCIQRAATGV
jgi:hypothetical protein